MPGGKQSPRVTEAQRLAFPGKQEMNVKAERSSYIERGNWRCSVSPNGAHHSIYDEKKQIGVCQYCGAEREWAKIPTMMQGGKQLT